MATAFAVLAEPSRRELVSLLCDDELSVGALVERTTMSQPSVSKHLRVLREAGLVSVRRDAQQRLYRLREEPFREVADWIAPFIEVWNGRLDQLEAHLETMPETRLAHIPETPHDAASDPREQETRS